MSVYLHVTLEIHAAGLSRFLEAMDKTAAPVAPARKQTPQATGIRDQTAFIAHRSAPMNA